MREVQLVVMTDGRFFLERTLPAALSMLHGAHISSIVIHDDSGDSEYRKWLQSTTEEFNPIYVFTPQRLGFSGAYNHAWSYLTNTDGPEWIFNLEDDFVIEHPVSLCSLMCVLCEHPNLAQIVLKRQAWNPEEIAAGGIVELRPNDFKECVDYQLGRKWTEHRRFFSTNPCLFRRSLCKLSWPNCSESEGIFTHQLLEDPDIRFAFWGGKFDPPIVEHIGLERIGIGY